MDNPSPPHHPPKPQANPPPTPMEVNQDPQS